MRRNYFNFSNLLDVTLYVLATLYVLDINIPTTNEPNCHNDLVSGQNHEPNIQKETLFYDLLAILVV